MQVSSDDLVKNMILTCDTLYVIMSNTTRLPFVECDVETYDDEVLLFTDEETMTAEKDRLTEAGYAIGAVNIPKEKREAFLMNLIPLGVNAVLIDKGSDDVLRDEITNIVTRPEFPRYTTENKEKYGADKGQRFRVENPEFHLTAIYFTQLFRNKKIADQDKAEVLKELNEEMMIHYREGYYLMAVNEKKEVPLVKGPTGTALFPLFTEVSEFVRFQQVNKTAKLTTRVTTEADVMKHLPKSATGVIVNPLGIGMVLQMNKKKAE